MNVHVTTIECIKSALKSLSSSKLRSFLTILGIVIGITAVTIISSLGGGLQQDIAKSLDSFGFDRIEVRGNYNSATPGELIEEDADFLLSHENIIAAIPFVSNYGQFELPVTKELEYVMLNGTSNEYINMLSDEVVQGRFLLQSDIDSANNVMVISDRLAEAYFGYTDVLGETIEISVFGGPEKFSIIGVTKSEGNDIFMNGYQVYVPYTYIQNSYNIEYLEGIYIGIKDNEFVGDTAEDVIKMLRIKHGAGEDAFTVFNMMQEVAQIKNVFATVVLFVNAVASIALFVGSIGIMNIMLVTVTERTREIGIRKSLGATKKNIRTQFLIESVVLSVIGGLIGVVLGYALAILAGGAAQITPIFSISSIITAILVCTIIGILSGVYPASKASNLNPIDALRYE